MAVEMFALGIDSATSTGWALVERANHRERVLGHGVLDLSGRAGLAAEVIAGFVRTIAEKVPLAGLPVAIELPYLACVPAANVVTLRTLARFCGRWEQVFQERGADVELSMADHWYRCVVGHTREHLKRDARKRMTQLWVRGTFCLRLGEDEADAIGLAVCLLREREYRARVDTAAVIGSTP